MDLDRDVDESALEAQWPALMAGLFALAWLAAAEALGFVRNHYDRLVHFLFGLLCYRPLREVLAPALVSRRAWAAPVAAVATVSLLYEQVEMWAALVFGGDLGQAYLGTQGDVWDAQKDSTMALSGAMLAAALHGLRRRKGPGSLSA